MSTGHYIHPSSLAALKDAGENTTSVGESRRRDLVAAAFDVITERGFEGLRTRDVAERAAVNNATLYYYFPTKEGLIQGVAEYMVQQLAAMQTPTDLRADMTALDELRLCSANFVATLLNAPDLLRVMTELLLRAERDPHVFEILKQSDARWHTYLQDLVVRGIDQGTFRADLHPEETAYAMMAFFKGMTLQLNVPGNATQRVIDTLEQWLLV